MSDEYSASEAMVPGPVTKMRIDILTLFPKMFRGPFDDSMIARARGEGILDLQVHDLRRWSPGKHRQADDAPYGGGGGMVLQPEPVFSAVEDILGLPPLKAGHLVPPPCPVALLTPQGRPFDHGIALELAAADRLLLICGHYEGVDERIREHLATVEISVGDFVVTGGEIPAMLVTDAVARLRPGVLGGASAVERDSFAAGLLEHPQYTRPADFRGWEVPAVLLSGDHSAIDVWRRRRALRRTWLRRPDLLEHRRLSGAEQRWLDEWRGRQAAAEAADGGAGEDSPPE